MNSGGDEYKGILVFSEEQGLALELLGKGSELAQQLNTQLATIIVGDGEAPSKELANTFIAHGADKVFSIPCTYEHFDVEIYTDILTEIIKDSKPEIVIIGANKNGKELAPRVAARLKRGCITDCINLQIDKGGGLTAERVVYGGNAVAQERFNAKPQIVTVPPRTFEPSPKDTSRKGEIIHREISVSEPRVKIIKLGKREVEGVRLEDAEIIVSCGRGVKNKEDIKLIEDLAKVLGGEVGCSRPIASDLKWLSVDHWVGLSGHKVKPRLYLACGISGQIQHLAGMRDSDIIVAVNKDPEAPIFKAADYGIVGDLYKIVPALIEEFKKYK
jgi:electron transfer flavoprotein alpha subunit